MEKVEKKAKSKQPRVIKLVAPLSDTTEASFFMVVNPGLEKIAHGEVQEKLNGLRLESTVGGIQFDSTWGKVREAQAGLKTATRILVRVDQFGARDFQKLFKKVAGLPWKEWLKPGTALEVRASSHGSRLRIKKAIERTVLDGFEKATGNAKTDSGTKTLCLVRMEDDICTISLDLSGDLLHKRGTREDVGRAPLRETWASALIESAFKHIGRDKDLTTEFSREWDWIEPMAGTAVFLREALAVKTTRTFAIDDHFQAGSRPTPKLQSDVQTSVKTSSASNSGEADDPASSVKLLSFMTRAWVIDRDPEQLSRAKKGLENSVRQHPAIHFGFARDYTQIDPPQMSRSRLVIVNPPWGVRLKGPEAVNSSKKQEELLSQISIRFQPRFVAVIVPRLPEARLKLPPGWQELEGFEFRAGGVPVQARFFTVSVPAVDKANRVR